MKDSYIGYIIPGDCYELWDETIAYVTSTGEKYVECYIRSRHEYRSWQWCLFTLKEFKKLVRTIYMEE